MCLCYPKGRDGYISTDFLFQYYSTPVAVGLCVFFSFVQHGGKVKSSCFTSHCPVSFQLRVRCIVDFSHLRCLHTVPIPSQGNCFLMPSLNVSRRSCRNLSAAWIWLLTILVCWHCWIVRDWVLLCWVSALLPGVRKCACHKYPVVKCQLWRKNLYC